MTSPLKPAMAQAPQPLIRLLAAAAAAALLAGCATPQAALDQANATAALTARFDRELAAYRNTAAQVARARLASIQRQEAALAKLAEVDTWNQRTADLAGLGDVQARSQALVDLAMTREADEAATRQRLAELNTQLAAVVTALPSTSAKLATLRKQLAEMGAELPGADRLKLALDAVGAVGKEVKKNADAAASAASAAKSAGVQTDAPTTLP